MPGDGSSLRCQVSNRERTRYCKTPAFTTVPAAFLVASMQVLGLPLSPTSPSNPILKS